MALRVTAHFTTAALTHKDEAAAQESRRTMRRSKCFARTMYGALVLILLAAPTTEAATTEAPTTEAAAFLLGDAGVVGCPQGYLGIFQETTCRQASSHLGLGGRLTPNSISAAYPGCYYSHGSAYFNTHPSPDGTLHTEHAGQICISSEAPQHLGTVCV